MRNLKFGDIKKFIKGDSEFVGVVVKVGSNAITLINTDGKIGDLSFNDNIKYSATRLDPKLRTQLEKIAEEKRKYDRMEEEYKKLGIEKEKQLEKVRAEISKVLSAQGKFGVNDTCRVFQERLKKVHPNLCKKLVDNYKWEAYSTPVGVWMQMRRYDYFDKWVSDRSYDFIYWNYENILMLKDNYKTNQYKELCKKYSRNDANFTMSDLRGKYQSEGEIKPGDKDSLCYCHTISILLPPGCLTENYVDKLIATIKY